MKAVTVMPTVEDLVDQLGKIEQELERSEVAQWKAQEKRAAGLRKLISDLIGAPAAASATVKGRQYTALVGPRQDHRPVTTYPIDTAPAQQRLA